MRRVLSYNNVHLDRAVRGAEDDAFFAQINDDRLGYMNSNGGNNHLPGPGDAERFRKSMEDNLISAVRMLAFYPARHWKTTVAFLPKCLTYLLISKYVFVPSFPHVSHHDDPRINWAKRGLIPSSHSIAPGPGLICRTNVQLDNLPPL